MPIIRIHTSFEVSAPNFGNSLIDEKFDQYFVSLRLSPKECVATAGDSPSVCPLKDCSCNDLGHIIVIWKDDLAFLETLDFLNSISCNLTIRR